MRRILPIGVLVSGRGSNLQAIIDAVKDERLEAEIRVVISNNPDAKALERAERYGIPAEVIPDKGFSSTLEYDRRVVDILKDRGVKLVALAGFMRILSKEFINAFPLRLMNIHPSLLPSFPGLNVQEKAIKYGVKFSGCTVHFVDEGVDTGPIIIQAVVPIHDDDTEDSLSARILREEHKIYPQAIQLFAEERLEVIGRRVIIKDHPMIKGTMENPIVTVFREEGSDDCCV